VATFIVWGCSSTPETELIVAPQDAGTTDVVADVPEDVVDAEEVGSDAMDAGEDASVWPVLVALHSTPGYEGDGETAEASKMDAVLVALAAGARAVVVELKWSDLPLTAGEWARLGALGAYLNAERKHLLLSVAAVDARADERAIGLRIHAWTSLVVQQAMQDLIDRLFATFGSELAYVSLGMEVDRFLAAHPSQGTDFASFMAHALTYGRGHPNKPERTSLGVTWSTEAWVSGEENLHRDALAEVSDVVMLAHCGLDEAKLVRAPGDSIAQLREAVKAIEEKPVVLHRVSYSTSSLIGGSRAGQSAFVTQLFGLVQEQRERIPFVGVATLHDPSLESCLSYAQARDPGSSAELYAFWCNVGLRTRQGEAKEGFSAFLSGAPGFLSP
jgi:hypothetical protein